MDVVSQIGGHFQIDSVIRAVKQRDCATQPFNTTSAHARRCPPLWDTLLCWPPTPAGTFAVQACFRELNGIQYDVSRNATRWCRPNGHWEPYINYSGCTDIDITARDLHPIEFYAGIEITSFIYIAGYTLSLISLSCAIAVLIAFKELACVRNTIHINLMMTYILADFMWILTLLLQLNVQSDIKWCVVFITLLHYFHLTNFFWMFVEGLYLYMLVVETFYTETLKINGLAVIGWGGPLVFVTTWGITKKLKAFPDPGDENPTTNFLNTVEYKLLRHCPWLTPHPLDWIYQAPVLCVLTINFVFLVLVMWTLITKMRAANNVETQQYRKAAKALLVLIPLLGTTYLLLLYGPTEGISRSIYDAIKALLLSTQGFSVSLFYCFLNGEVQTQLKHYMGTWKQTRSLRGSRRSRNASKDWSPRSRTESIRLYFTQHSLKRQSTTSTSTIMGPCIKESRKSCQDSSQETIPTCMDISPE